jgi:signal transduction histidine kinase
MFLKIALLISVAMQVSTAVVAIGMIKKTRYNVSWILISLALLLMAVRRLYELPQVVDGIIVESPFTLAVSWLGVLVSILFLAGIIFIRRIFKKLNEAETLRSEMDRKVLEAIIRAEESERRRVAKELHDGLGPLLSNLKMAISTLQPGCREEQEELVTGMKQAVNESINAIREISNNLSPHVLENFGLLSALKAFTGKSAEGQGVNITFDQNIGQLRFHPDVEMALYRVICELINNTLKHAGASEILVRIRLAGNTLLVDYHDNGRGLSGDPSIGEMPGMGIYNMISRMKSLNGSVTFDSASGQGFHATVVCPAGYRKEEI